MAGKKAKSAGKKVAAKAAPKAGKKAAEKKSAKSGALGSLKQMLRLGTTKQTAKADAKNKKATSKAATKIASKAVKPEKKAGKSTSKAASSAMQQPPRGATEKPAKPEKGAKRASRAKSSAHSSQSAQSILGDLRPSPLRPQAEPIVAGAPVCREVACELMSTTGGYCRMHYIKNWKKIKRKEMILKEHKLNSYIEELVSKYPDKYIEAIRQDLASEKDFAKVVADLEIDEGLDDFESVETESAEGIIDNLKRDFEDEGDVF